MLKAFFKSLIKVICIFCIVFLLFAAFLAIDRKLAEHRAYEFCEKSMQAKNANEIKDILNNTNGAKKPVFLENYISVNFPLIFPERFTCSIELDESGRPSEMDVLYLD